MAPDKSITQKKGTCPTQGEKDDEIGTARFKLRLEHQTPGKPDFGLRLVNPPIATPTPQPTPAPTPDHC